MKIVQATFGVFHHFELARELLRRGHLQCIFSTFPWRRLEREGIPRDLVETFPLVHTTQILFGQRNWLTPALNNFLAYRNATSFDRYTLSRVPPCDALIALSGAALATGKKVQGRGGRFICDRGSTHRGFQDHIVAEEHRIWGQPYIPDDPKQMAREERIYQQADAIVVPSEVARRSFLAQGLPPEKVHTIPYGVRLELFTKQGDPPSGRFEVLFVGGISLRKGIPYLLQAFAALRHPHKRLRIIGAVPPELRNFLAGFPHENVEFLGTKPQAELVSYMSTSHVMVLPSIEEGLALVQGQALACGCPVLVTTATGAEDLFTDGLEGFIVPIRDLRALSARLQQLADDPALRHRMSVAALARVRQIGGWTRYGDKWEALLHTLTRA